MIFHHVGIPSDQVRSGETYLEGGRVYVTDAAVSPYRIEWLRFEPNSPMPLELKSGPHVAYLVDNLDRAMAGKTVILEPFVPMPGLRVGFVNDDGAIVEFMEKTA